MLAFACTLISAGSYFAQPLVNVISPSLGLGSWAVGLPVTLSQVGYCLALLLIAPLGDRIENRRLLLCNLFLSIGALFTAGIASTGGLFLFACFFIGVASIAVQSIVVMAASMSSSVNRGQTVGRVTAGLLFGVLLAWPAAALINSHFGWRALYIGDAGLIALLALSLRIVLVVRRPEGGAPYLSLISSLPTLWLKHPELRRRALCQALFFGIFSLFWVTAPLELRTRYDIGANALAYFGLIGVGGALAAPVAGWFADRGLSGITSMAGSTCVALGCLAWVRIDSFWALLGAAFLISAGVQTCHVIAQRRILLLQPNAANRLNSLYIATFFAGGAVGSASASPLFFAHGYLPGCVALSAATIAWVVGLFINLQSFSMEV
ncbi:MFS transporter [Pseudomonas sp. HN11]|uniref:MFS transporter n=1 Tax=Pseudomonas sp. HN11 TaxID=1344094 RepID=UPI001F46B0B7|nr:MFS transporter [Pseudomonas sp. HN11]UII69887.1 MFS transporter [Pseudomonas sp. HN11]